MLNPYDAPESALEETAPQTARFRMIRFRIARFLSFGYLFLVGLLCFFSIFRESQKYNFGAELIGGMLGIGLLCLLMAAPLYYFLKATKKTAIGGVKKAFRWNVVIAVFLFALCLAGFLPTGQLGLGLVTFTFVTLPYLFNAYCLFRKEDEEDSED